MDTSDPDEVGEPTASSSSLRRQVFFFKHSDLKVYVPVDQVFVPLQ